MLHLKVMHIIMQKGKQIYDEVPTMDLKRSNYGLLNLLNSGKKILISRMGEETGGLALLSKFNKLPDGIRLHEIISLVTTYAGIYSKNSKDYKHFYSLRSPLTIGSPLHPIFLFINSSMMLNLGLLPDLIN